MQHESTDATAASAKPIILAVHGCTTRGGAMAAAAGSAKGAAVCARAKKERMPSQAHAPITQLASHEAACVAVPTNHRKSDAVSAADLTIRAITIRIAEVRIIYIMYCTPA